LTGLSYGFLNFQNWVSNSLPENGDIKKSLFFGRAAQTMDDGNAKGK
jgi:hypothetical protein